MVITIKKFMATIINIKMPKTRSAGIGDNMFATNAAAVVNEVIKVAFMARAYTTLMR